MDIIGVVASTLQFIDALVKTHDYVKDFQDAREDQRRILREVISVKPLLEELDKRIKNPAGVGNGIDVKQLEGRLLDLKSLIDRLSTKLAPPVGWRRLNRFKWGLWGKNDVKEALSTIERFKTMSIWESVSDLAEEQRIDREYLVNIERSFKEQRGDFEDARQAERFEHRAGAGKTVISSIVVNALRSNVDGQNIGVAVIYLNHQETEAQSPSNLVAGLWRQLVFEKGMSASVRQLHEKHCEPRTRPTLEETHYVLCSTVLEYSKVFIIVDALDEYPEQQRHILLHRLSSLTSTVNLMFTSRAHISIGHVVPNLESLEIRATEGDIRRYLYAEILRSSRLSRHIESRPDLREEIEKNIVRRSDGMFLLAKLHIDSLATKHTTKAVRDALVNMPGDLDSTYDEIVGRINGQSEDDKKLAWRIISWVANAKRPLRPSELREVLAVELGSSKLDPENLLDMATILSVCAGLVVFSEEDKRIRLIHYTIQKYLNHVLATAFPDASTEITRMCITYLNFDTFSQNAHDPMSLFHQISFLDYAVEYGLAHARGRPESDIQDLILSFLSNCSVWWKLRSWNGCRRSLI
ncbi:Ankyrin repeat-containing protein [Mycena venus]|uniref:Ankyrin repeat-containing protein n=1 Tax=Mycena venus TaxID=2733690 RepID=A0A8H7DD90_9AGAR|nr:Ankyrin repeat-containing protein [Mycena venus]